MPSHLFAAKQGVARNTLWNLFGYLAPTVVALLALPPTVRLLGADRYGLLAIVLVVHDYFNYFDFGLGRATTRFMSAALHEPMERGRAGTILWTCISYHVALGLLVAGVFWVALPLISHALLGSSPTLMAEGAATLKVAALLPPVLLFMIAGRGALEAAERFDLVNAVKVPLNSLTFVVPLWGAIAGLRLPGIILIFVLVRFVAGAAYLALCLRQIPGARLPRLDHSLRGPLFSFGGSIMATNLIGLLLIDGERFLIPALASVGALTYYAIPNDATTRLWILPASVASVLFPIFARLGVQGRDDAGRIYADSTLYLLILFVPIVVIIEGFAGPLLAFWMGTAFAESAQVVLQVATLGVMADSLARVPMSYLQAVGLPQIPARIRLWQLPAYCLVAVVCIERWGIVGAAIAWSGRIVVETAILFGVVHWRKSIAVPGDANRRLRRGFIASAGALAACGTIMLAAPAPMGVRAIAIPLVLSAFVLFAWVALVDTQHRAQISAFFRRKAMPLT